VKAQPIITALLNKLSAGIPNQRTTIKQQTYLKSIYGSTIRIFGGAITTACAKKQGGRRVKALYVPPFPKEPQILKRKGDAGAKSVFGTGTVVTDLADNILNLLRV